MNGRDHPLHLNRSNPNENRAATQLPRNSPQQIQCCSDRQRAHDIGTLSVEDQQKVREELGSSAEDRNILVAFIPLQSDRVMLSSWNYISSL